MERREWTKRGLLLGAALASGLGAASTSASAQSAPGSAAAVAARGLRPGIEEQSVYFDEPGDGRIWARGRTYKASFGAEGASYIPFLGSHTPRNFPVTFTLAAVDVGGTGLQLDRIAAPQRVGDSIEFRRGTVVERYDLAPDGMEQTFRVTGRPNAGELRFVLELTSALQPALDGNGLHLRGEWGGIDVSAAVAVDARGSRVELGWESRESAFELRVPAAFLASAAYPIAIDPWISTFALDVSPAEDRAADVCLIRGDQSDTPAYVVAWERVVSALDHDLWWAVYYADGTFVPTSGMWADITGIYWAKPRLASIPGATFPADAITLLVSEVGTPAGVHWIYGRRRIVNAQDVQFQISPTDSHDKVNPAVGGSAWSGANDFCVVWQRNYSSTDSDIHAIFVDKSGNPGANTILVDDTGALDSYPDISRSVGGWNGTWAIVWEREYSVSDHDIYGAVVNDFGGIDRPTFAIEASGWHDTRPQASMQDIYDRCVVVFERELTSADSDVMAAVLSGGTTQVVHDLSQMDGSAASGSQQAPDVDVDAGRYVVTSMEYPPSSLYANVMASTFHFAPGPALELTEGHVALSASYQHQSAPRIACDWSGGFPVRSQSMVVYGLADLLTSVYDIGGAVYELPIPGFVSFCAGDGLGSTPTTPCPCGNFGLEGSGCANSVNPYGAVLFASGTPILDDVVLGALGMPATVICIYLQGDAVDDIVFGDGVRCVAGTLLRLRARANVGGASSFPDSTDTVTLAGRGGVLPGSGVRLYYQTYYRNAAASYCPPATFNVTNGRVIDW